MPITIDPNVIYSEQEYADLVGKQITTVRKDRSRGTGPAFVKLGAGTFYRGADILEFMERRRVRHGAQYQQVRARERASHERGAA